MMLPKRSAQPIGGRSLSFEHTVDAARQGDDDAISQLYLNHVPMVYGYLRACRVTDPDDVTSEVFVGMLRGLERFSGDHADFRRWLMTIAHRRLVDHRRRGVGSRIQLTEPSTLETVDLVGQARDLPALELDGDLVAAFGSLTEEQREVLALRFIADVSLRGVAEITGRPTGAVKSLQNRGLTALRRTLSAERVRQGV